MPGHPSPDAGTSDTPRSTPATPGACASIIRAAISSAGPRTGPADVAAVAAVADRPTRTWSLSQDWSSARPFATRWARCSARCLAWRAADWPATVPDSADEPESAGSVLTTDFSAFSARARRSASHPAAKSAGALSSGNAPLAQFSSSPSACLQGNFLDGQEHLYAGPLRSTTT